MPRWSPKIVDQNRVASVERVNICFDPISLPIKLNADTDYNKGIKQFSKEQFEKALTSFNKAIKKNPTRLDYYFNRALTLIKLKRSNEACTDLLLIKARDEDSTKLFDEYCN